MWKSGSYLYFWWCEETLCLLLLWVTWSFITKGVTTFNCILCFQLSGNYYIWFFGISRKIRRTKTFWLFCLVFGDKSPQSRHAFWVGRRWGSAGRDVILGRSTWVPGPPFSAREFIESQLNYRTDRGICLKIIFYREKPNNPDNKNSSLIAALAWSRSECLFLCFLWRVVLWNPKGLV